MSETIVTPAPAPIERSDTDPPPAVIDVPPPEEKIPELVEDEIERQRVAQLKMADDLMQPARTEPPPPTQEQIDAVVRYFSVMRATLINQVSDIEDMLGFIREDAQPLSVRVAKLERFCGIKG